MADYVPVSAADVEVQPMPPLMLMNLTVYMRGFIRPDTTALLK